ncbi:hypothetical protein Poli38472_003267 [Pythium oligandrum]|uniref:Aldehyde dehydrogenase domain-containing protein n=1 Tax=Pythium oligandrum TaxID=41045 RepID=A0A8K1C7A6_PYTOL|nr:hypothetical protein Poli38472_003267 [Pythium oligandrum]|eukprot:TMW57342.1 hypothetical protein Poli38472_003267 [Pythium oligandrum]
MGSGSENQRQQRQVATIADVAKSSLLCKQGYINGKWVDAQDKATFPVKHPATEECITEIAALGPNETQKAIEAAVHAQKEWKKTSPLTRSQLLKKWYQLVVDNIDEIALLTTAEAGKPLAESKGEAVYAAGFIDFFAHECMHSGGFVVPANSATDRMIAVTEPVGVCAIITPWNFPLAMITRKLAPCLAAGCSAVLRPACETPLSALALVKLAEQAGFPKGVINIIISPHEHSSDVGKALATNEQIRKLSFTGSTRVGRLLMEQSSVNVKRISLELGGNAPFIVFEDADLDAAVKGLLGIKFKNDGQVCITSNRVFVHSSIFETFKKQFVKEVKNLKMGSPFSEDTNLGPLINTKSYKKVSELVQDALDKGAEAVTGGKGADSTTYGHNFYEPTVLVNVKDSMRVWSEEIFGPVVPLIPFDNEQQVLEIANDTISGLAGYFFTRDLARAWRVAGALECGMIGVNSGDISTAQAPFGGVKQSGVGREGSFMGIQEYLETKLIAMGGLA